MQTFKTKSDGEFSVTFVNNTLSFHGVHEHIHLDVPEHMRAEGRRLLRRESGDDVLDFARLCIVHETALKSHQEAA